MSDFSDEEMKYITNTAEQIKKDFTNLTEQEIYDKLTQLVWDIFFKRFMTDITRFEE